MSILCAFLIFTCRHVASHTAAEPSFFSAANYGHRIIYDHPRPLPARRGDVPPQHVRPISPSRFVSYGSEGHPYERVRRLRDEVTNEEQETGSLSEGDNQREDEILRILQADRIYHPLRIHFDTVRFQCAPVCPSSKDILIIFILLSTLAQTDLDRWSSQSTLTAKRVKYLKSLVLPRMATIWSSALSVVPVVGSLKIDYNMCPFGDLATSPSFSEIGVGNTDLVIYVTAGSGEPADALSVFATSNRQLIQLP